MRTCYIGELGYKHLGRVISLCGWVNSRRDHGGVIFIDLRDRTGLIQVVFNPEEKSFFDAEHVRNEYCLRISGLMRQRPASAFNNELRSGEIEILCKEIEVLNESVVLPFQLDDDNLSETTRLTHRILDLRRPKMQRNLLIRYRIAMEIRKFLDNLGFIDIETPMLTKSTPEGARDYLVPSRINSGKFFALPQSPQLFKQMLMIAGFDRYYQIIKCFRDEDLRADRQPEFTQIDCETSFLSEIEIREIFGQMISHIFKEVKKIDLPIPFPVISWSESIYRYGSDTPDLRINLEFTDITEISKSAELKVFSNAANLPGGRVVALRVPGGANISRTEIDSYSKFVKIYGAKGLAYIKVINASNGRFGLQSPIVKGLSDHFISRLIDLTRVQNNDIIFFGADKAKIVNDSIGFLRIKIGHSEFGRSSGLLSEGWRPVWVVDFPMFDYDEESERYVPAHHPFTSPKDGDEDYLETNPGRVFAKAYDMVLNGCEIGGGSVRIHREDIQKKVFRALGIENSQSREKFGFLLDALKYGAPPHGGIAFGLDRIAAMLLSAESIRDVIAFPKTQRTQCLLTQAPSQIDKEQLDELHIRVQDTFYDQLL